MRGNTGNNSDWFRGAAIAAIATMFSCVAVPAGAATEKVVYAFKGGSDGAGPQAGLLDVKGVLYGTTASGGTGSCSGGCGTVFKLTAGGKEKVLYSFQGGSDGYDPTAGLIDVNGTLYGTTSSGINVNSGSCSSNCGTVFSITATGTEKVLHVFNGGSDGGGAQAALVDVKGVLYGTTSVGGSVTCYHSELPCGTVFSITPGGTENVLYTFKSTEGFNPNAGLITVNGILYGTAIDGPSGPCNGTPVGDAGCGTVFSITANGVEAVLYAFAGGNDGGAPYAGLASVKGALYGTTLAGGTGTCMLYEGYWQNSGCGTVFKVTRSGTEKVLHAFQAGSDGTNPTDGLIDVNGTLYGTTQYGGTGSCNNFPQTGGCGTVFSITNRGTERILYSFQGGNDGARPLAGLININGTLYGTTAYGGAGGFGTVFSITP